MKIVSLAGRPGRGGARSGAVGAMSVVYAPCAMTPRIEPMLERDIDAVVAIDGASDQSARWDAASVAEELGRTWARLWISRDEDAPAPPASFLVTWLVADELHVLNIATHPDRRRRGHARALLEHALAFARENAVRHVLLEVRRSNASAIELYRRLGFIAMGVRARYYPNDEDAVEMVLRLDLQTGAVVPGTDEVTL